MKRVFAYVWFNVKALMKDKVSFAWSIMLPLIMLFCNRTNISSEKDLIYWWVYMVICSYLYGIGIYALELKASGSLKTIFSVYNSSWTFFGGCLITQVIYSFFTITVFNCIAIVYLHFSILNVMLLGYFTVFLCIP